MSTTTHTKEAAPKQGCCGEHTSHSKTEGASGQTRQREKHIQEKPSAGSGSCCCGRGWNDNRSAEPEVRPSPHAKIATLKKTERSATSALSLV